MSSGALAAAGWTVAVAAVVAALLARQAMNGRMELVARACHELRGPLTAARLGLSLGERAGALSADRVRAIDLELGRAALAVDDLEGAGRGRSRPRNGDRHGVMLDLCALLEDSVVAWRAAALLSGVGIEIDCPAEPIVVHADRIRIAQATGNLIANALEHGHSDVLVRARTAAGVARVEFIDSGPGLPAPVAALAHRSRRGRGQRGRGLAIAQAVAVAHGGRLAAAPTESGARVVLELPLAASASHRPGSTTGTGPEPTERPGS
jgi:signal transduction histidine kinase